MTIDIEPNALFSIMNITVLPLLYFGLPIWFCAHYKLWGAGLSVLYLWAVPLVIMALEASLSLSHLPGLGSFIWLLLGWLPSLVLAAITYGITSALTPVIQKHWLNSEKRKCVVLRIEHFGLYVVLAMVALFVISWRLFADFRTGPQMVMYEIATNDDGSLRYHAIVGDIPSNTREVRVDGEITKQGILLERFEFVQPGDTIERPWHIRTVFRSSRLMQQNKAKQRNREFHTVVTAIHRQWGPLRIVHRWEDQRVM